MCVDSLSYASKMLIRKVGLRNVINSKQKKMTAMLAIFICDVIYKVGYKFSMAAVKMCTKLKLLDQNVDREDWIEKRHIIEEDIGLHVGLFYL